MFLKDISRTSLKTLSNALEMTIEEQSLIEVEKLKDFFWDMFIADAFLGYFDYISSLKNEECNKALVRIFDRIDLGAIYKLVEETPSITELQKDFTK